MELQEEQQVCKAIGEAFTIDSPRPADQLIGHTSIPHHKGVTAWTRGYCSTVKRPGNQGGAATVTGIHLHDHCSELE